MVGKGMMTMFWEDIWCCNRPLKFKFPRLFCLARQKKGMVVDYSSKNGFNSVNWGEFFTRTLLDREVVMLRRLEDMVRSIELVLEVENRLSWVHDSNGEFTGKKLSTLFI
ncbi:hypothetical protein ES288_A03G160300v1 [Gossypium darwinii]|uniref:Reverse transcriptase zinc-binding domain-containing protein n=1 Tax=Gossypium darwinii TaxID=34276 RepID=A0A5D2H5M7_GOSDA|nr:hypothetical protein ES288_A03G160300v1 [Gossypium darwinii]